tara:strand:+ start:1083 stop:1601 length:519 start_codon:yes stop_codon:yes gene_type:complete
MFISITAGLIGGLIACLVSYLYLSKLEPAKSKDSNKTKTEEPVNEIENSMQSLVLLNIEIRKTIIPKNIQKALETTIDDLVNILPLVNDAAPGGELYWVVNRMATEYLPEKSIRPYLSLNQEQRSSEEVITTLLDGLKGIQSELKDIGELLISKNTNEFNTKAKFLKHRFNV